MQLFPPLAVSFVVLWCLASMAGADLTSTPRVTKSWAFEPTNDFGDTYTHMSTLALLYNDTWVAAACQCVYEG